VFLTGVAVRLGYTADPVRSERTHRRWLGAGRALGLLGALAVGGCDPGRGGYFGRVVPKRSATFVFNNGAEPEYLDPGLMSAVNDARIGDAMFEGLTEYHEKTLTPVPGVAHRWEVSEDGRTYTFHLRRSARWSDGRPVTARDFLYSWERVLDPVTGARYAQQLFFIDNAEAYNASRVKQAREALSLRGGASISAPVVGAIAAGAVVEVLDSSLREPDGSPLLDTNARGVRRSGTLWEGADPPPPATRSGAGTVPVAPDDVVHLEDPFAEAPSGWVKVALPSRDKVGWLPEDELVVPHGGRHWLKVRAKTAPSSVGWVEASTVLATVDTLGVRAPDPYTLVVTLHSPAPFFLFQTSHSALRPVPRQAVDRWGPRWTRPEHIVTNGPFHLIEHLVRDKIVLRRSDSYWDRANVQLERVVAYAIDAGQVSANLYRTGETDVMTANELPTEYIPAVRGKRDFRYGTQLATYYYQVNVTRGPLADKRVRQALSFAIDRRAIAEALQSRPVPATGIVPPGLVGYTPAVGHRFDPARAARLLRDAGYPGGRGLPTITLLYNTTEGHKLIAAAVQESWRRHLGLDVRLENREWKTFLKDVRSHDYDIARGGWVGDYPDPNTFLDLWSSTSGNNSTQWSSKDYDETLTAASRERDPKRRMELLHRLEELLNDEVPVIPIYYYSYYDLVKPYVRNYHYTLIDKHPLQRVRLELGPGAR
jgi:oligopeptide transport system substrate-binding protein